MNNTNSSINNEDNSVKIWEELRRFARQYETELDSKLFSLSKLISTRNDKKYNYGGGGGGVAEDEEPLVNSKENFDRICHEIESLIASLQGVNNQMNQCVQQQLTTNHVVQYTLKRHQEILLDYRKEFHKVRGNIEEQLNRDLLMTSNNVRNTYGNDFHMPSHLRKANDYLIKESDHIRNSEIMIDDSINIAIRTRDTLRTQRSTMKAIRTQLATLSHKFSMINNVLHRIGIKKRKDTIILALVIGICLFILILWLF